MSTETTVQNLKINKLTKAQYDTITPSATEAYELTDLSSILDGKQATLVSGTNIKTINNTSLLGSGNIDIQGGGSVKGAITSSTNLTTLEEGIYTVDGITHSGFPDASQAFYGVLVQYGGDYKPQLLVAGLPAIGGLYHRRYLTASSSFTNWVRCGNAATGTNALTIGGTPSGSTGGTNIGISSQAKQNYGTALGFNTNANGNSSTCIGRNAGTSAASAIQIGAGINSTANTLQVGFIHANTNYQLLDGTTGKIPSDRLNIATSVSASSTNADVVGAKLFYDTVGNIETLLSQV